MNIKEYAALPMGRRYTYVFGLADAYQKIQNEGRGASSSLAAHVLNLSVRESDEEIRALINELLENIKKAKKD